MKIITRQQALMAGLPKYFTGIPCKHGHLAEKTTKKSMCLECKKQEYVRNSDRYKLANQAWKAANPDTSQRLNKEGYLRFRADSVRIEAKRQYMSVYSKLNKEKLRLIARNWDAANPEKRLAYAKHHKAIRKRLIAGQSISKNYTKEIYQFYLNCPSGMHVDHIVPLRGKLVSGLHVPWNLQYLLAEENIAKGNKFEGNG